MSKRFTVTEVCRLLCLALRGNVCHVLWLLEGQGKLTAIHMHALVDQAKLL